MGPLTELGEFFHPRAKDMGELQGHQIQTLGPLV